MLAERVLEWTEQWKREGWKEGRRDMLEKQLQRRFGVLPAWAMQRLNAADSGAGKGDRFIFSPMGRWRPCGL